MLKLLTDFHDERVQRDFWSRAPDRYRPWVDTAFQSYRDWWQRRAAKVPGLNHGVLPGDFSTTLGKNGCRIGILGLNGAFLQLAAGDFAGHLALDTRQFHVACARSGRTRAKKHHLCLLLTHHPPSWLDEPAQSHLFGKIANHGRFALHLCGHMHETSMTSLAEAGGDARNLFQGSRVQRNRKPR